MNELETILLGLDWEYTRNLLAARYRGMNFVLYTEDSQTHLAAYTKEAVGKLFANEVIGVRMDSVTVAAIVHTVSRTYPLFRVPASMAIVSAATLSAFPELRGCSLMAKATGF